MPCSIAYRILDAMHGFKSMRGRPYNNRVLINLHGGVSGSRARLRRTGIRSDCRVVQDKSGFGLVVCSSSVARFASTSAPQMISFKK
jgi:hypothetical protein